MMVTIRVPVNEAVFIANLLGRYCGPDNDAMPAYVAVRNAIAAVDQGRPVSVEGASERSVAAVALGEPR